MSIGDLFTDMRNIFDHRTKKMELGLIFKEEKWQQSEPFSQYYHKQLILETQVRVEKGEMIHCLINGIPDAQLKNQAQMNILDFSSELL